MPTETSRFPGTRPDQRKQTLLTSAVLNSIVAPAHPMFSLVFDLADLFNYLLSFCVVQTQTNLCLRRGVVLVKPSAGNADWWACQGNNAIPSKNVEFRLHSLAQKIALAGTPIRKGPFIRHLFSICRANPPGVSSYACPRIYHAARELSASTCHQWEPELDCSQDEQWSFSQSCWSLVAT